MSISQSIRQPSMGMSHEVAQAVLVLEGSTSAKAVPPRGVEAQAQGHEEESLYRSRQPIHLSRPRLCCVRAGARERSADRYCASDDPPGHRDDEEWNGDHGDDHRRGRQAVFVLYYAIRTRPRARRIEQRQHGDAPSKDMTATIHLRDPYSDEAPSALSNKNQCVNHGDHSDPVDGVDTLSRFQGACSGSPPSPPCRAPNRRG